MWAMMEKLRICCMGGGGRAPDRANWRLSHGAGLTIAAHLDIFNATGIVQSFHKPETPVLGSARLGGERATFVSAKVAKTIGACGGGRTNIVFVRLPLPLASRAPARTRTSVCSNMRAFPACSASRLRHRQRRG